MTALAYTRTGALITAASARGLPDGEPSGRRLVPGTRAG
jgi:hypothetical protein